MIATLLGLPAAASAQRRDDSGGGERAWFASASAGIQFGPLVLDDASSSRWDIDAAFSWRATVERAVSPGVTAGLAFSHARLPMTYVSTAASSSCARCAADVTVSSYGGIVRVGPGSARGFHQVLEVFVGALRYGNFEQVSPRGRLAPASNTDFAFGAGYGFAYAIGNDYAVQLVQDAVNALHERSTQGGGRLARHLSTRLGVRVGF